MFVRLIVNNRPMLPLGRASSLSKFGGNPFEIIQQTKRKENNWKTEETLQRVVVTLETVRIKGSNPWCL